jgi:hypothetical protein
VTRRWVTALAAITLVSVSGCGDDETPRTVAVSDVDDAGEFDHEYVIPAGTGDLISDGVDVDIVPRELVVSVGDSIRIVNEDDRGHTVGVFYVGAGETLTQRFDSAGVLEGLCDIHSSGSFTLRVEA